MADVHSKLDELTKTVEHAKSVPLSASCVVHRTEVLAALDEVRQLLPSELAAAGDLLRGRRDIEAEAEAAAAEILAAARAERDRIVSATEIVLAAKQRAAEIVATAETQSATMRREVENYVDGKLANFEVVLQKTVAAVSRGRDKLRGSVDDLSDDEPAVRDPMLGDPAAPLAPDAELPG